jgi:prepilin-type N-terminal cleavage/methylation domain-containing protein
MLRNMLQKLNNKRVISNEDGFTLIEILFAIMLVGIITAALILLFKPIFGKGKVSAAVGSINNLKANAMIFSSDNQNSYANISISEMVKYNILGPNWNGGAYATSTSTSTSSTTSIICTATTSHCDPWGYTYVVAPYSVNPTSIFRISLGGVPAADAYGIASQFWNSDANINNVTGDTGTYFGAAAGSGGTMLTPGIAPPTTPLIGVLTVYFGY